jgi:hypothetical protein
VSSHGGGTGAPHGGRRGTRRRRSGGKGPTHGGGASGHVPSHERGRFDQVPCVLSNGLRVGPVRQDEAGHHSPRRAGGARRQEGWRRQRAGVCVIAPGAYGRVARKDGAGSVQASVSLHPAHMDAYKAHFFLSYLL